MVAGTPAEWDQSIIIPGGGESSHQYPTWSPCGRLIATSHQGTVDIWDAFSSELISTLQPTEPISELIGLLAYSPDGHSLATLSNISLKIWDIQTGGVTKEVDCSGASYSHLVWSLDGQMIGMMITVLLSGNSNFNYTACVYNVGLCQEYVYMVHLFPSLLPFLFLSQPVLTDYTPFTLYLSTRTYLQSFVLCAPFPTRLRHRVTKRVTFPFYLFLAL